MNSVDKLLGLYANTDAGRKLWEMAFLLESKDFFSCDGGIFDDTELDRAEILSDTPFNVDCGATRVCLVFSHLVLKKNFSGHIGFNYVINDYDEENPISYVVDYCKKEERIYKDAVKEGVEEFFAEVEEICDGVYAQPTCTKTVYESDSSKDFGEAKPESSKELCQLNALFDWKVPAEVILFWFLTKPVDKIEKLATFLKQHRVNDLHRENMGWFGGEIRFFDYCGFSMAEEF